jgi:micrococcal nuclease
MTQRAPSPTLALIVGAGLAAALALWQPLTVVDGDTVDYGLLRWRLAGLDTPEVRRPLAKCDGEIALGRKASARISAMIAAAGHNWRLEPTGRLDKWRHPIARLTLNGQDVAGALIAEGLAHPYDGRTKAPWCASHAP